MIGAIRSDATGPVIVGELNPYGADPEMAMYPLPRNSAGNRMQRLVLGIRRHRYVDLERFNLCDGKWSQPRARDRADLLLQRYRHIAGRPIVMLGRKVASAFNQITVCDRFEFYTVSQPFPFPETLQLVLLPHPSGLNRMWQERDAVSRCRELLRPLCPGLPLGEIDREL